MLCAKTFHKTKNGDVSILVKGDCYTTSNRPNPSPLKNNQ